MCRARIAAANAGVNGHKKEIEKAKRRMSDARSNDNTVQGAHSEANDDTTAEVKRNETVSEPNGEAAAQALFEIEMYSALNASPTHYAQFYNAEPAAAAASTPESNKRRPNR